MLLLGFLAALAHAQDPTAWLAQPVAPELHPVGPAYLYDWQVTTSRIMGGRRASPLFRSTAAAMDVHWRLAAYDAEAPLLLDDQQQQARQLAWTGASLGMQQTVESIVTASPELGMLYRCVRTVTAPSVEIQARPGQFEGDRADVRLNVNQGSRNRAVDLAAFEEQGTARRAPRFRLGGGLDIVQLEGRNIAEDELNFGLGLSSSAELDRLGPLNLRARATVVRPNEDVTRLSWNGSARLPLSHGVSLMSGINGDAESVFRLNSGVELRPQKAPSYNIRLVATQRIDTQEERLMLTLNRQLRWRLPNDIRSWPLGAEIGAPGPLPQSFPNRQPHQLTNFLPPSPDQVAVGERPPPDPLLLFRRGPQLSERPGGIPGDIDIAALAQLSQERQSAAVSDEAQRPDGVEGDGALGVLPPTLDGGDQ